MEIYEDLKSQYDLRQQAAPEVKMLVEDPVKFLSNSYAALTEDFDKFKMANDPSSKDWIISKVLRQQAKHLLEDTTTTTPSGQSFTFTTIAMPLVRKIFSKLLAMDLVSIQPIAQPTAKIFYLDFQYHNTFDQATADDSVAEVRSPNYATTTESGTVQELDLKITNETVTAIEKKLKAIWTVELEQDLMAYHGLNAETELMTVLQEQIVREIDGLIITALLAGAGGSGYGTGTGAGNVNWNINGQLAGDTSTTFLKDYKRTLYEAVVDASNLIYKKRYRYANWIIGHPDTIVRLEKLEEFRFSPANDPSEFAIGRHLSGTLNDRYRVYKDPFFPVTNKLLMGYKGNTWTDSVGFYSPYIPLYVTPKIVDTNDFTPRKGLMTRFAYGTLIKDGLATVTLTQS
jgi:hypothetical protein